jgi:outer membrane protein insertion porin family
MSVSMQVGGRSNRYALSFQEPWFMNRPIRLGASIYRRDYDYGASLSSTSTGFGFVVGRRIGRFSNIDLSYNYEKVSQTTTLTSAGELASELVRVTNDTKISSVTPVFNHSTINNPYRPSAGKSFTGSLTIAGGPLGGESSFLKPIVSFTGYRRAMGKAHVAFHVQAGAIRSWQGGGGISSSNVQGVPRYQRFWLGGDTLGPRVFETRSITPLRYVKLNEFNQIVDVIADPTYQPGDEFVTGGIPVPVLIEVGGDRFYLFQTEYVIPFNEQVEFAAFVDVGDALFEDQSWSFENVRVSAGIEARFHLPIFPVPLRLIYGMPVRQLERDRTGNFTFSIGRSF